MRERAAIWVTAGFLAACGGSAGPEVRFDDFEDELERAFCEFYVRCGFVPDLATCLVTSAAPIETDRLITIRSGVAAGVIDFHGDDAAACVALIDGLECTRSSTAEQFRTDRMEETCEPVFTGTVAGGGACSINEQCVSGECLLGGSCTEACCPGVCQTVTPPPDPLPIGAECASDEQCGDGAYCRMDAGPFTCQALVGENGPCDSTDACQYGLFCVSDGVTGTTCRTAAAEGESCDVTLCDELDDFCHPTTSICTQLPAPGESCADSLACIGWADCLDGLCVAAGLAGDACGGTAPSCLGDLDCEAGVCVLPADPTPCILE